VPVQAGLGDEDAGFLVWHSFSFYIIH
jgi:hypothetical protein